MKIVIVFDGENALDQPWPNDQPAALRRLAGSNVLHHILTQLRDLESQEVVVLPEKAPEEVTAWVDKNLPQATIAISGAGVGKSSRGRLADLGDWLDDGPLLLVMGNRITEADFLRLVDEKEHVVCFHRPAFDRAAAEAGISTDVSSWAGVCFFPSGQLLHEIVRSSDNEALAMLPAQLQSVGLEVDEREATLSVGTETIDALLQANARLLGIGYGSEDAIERSYAEDFTVLPPVFLHETAVIENAVIGPFVNVEAGALIRNSVVRNSLVGCESLVEDTVLDGALVGDRATIRGSKQALVVQDDSEVVIKGVANTLSTPIVPEYD